MSNSVIQGSNCIIKVLISGDYFPLICAKSFSIIVTTGIVETTTATDGEWKSFDYDSMSYTISFDGVLQIADLLSENGVFDVLSTQINFIELGYKMIFTSPEGTVRSIKGSAIITQTTLGAAASQVATGQIELQGSGAFTIDAAEDDCSTVITSVDIVAITPGVIYNFHPVTTGDTAVRFDWSLDGGGFNSAFADNWNIDVGYGTHHITIIPYCENGVQGATFDEDFGLISPP